MNHSDVVHLAQQLIQCPSITPEHSGSLDLIEGYLKNLGFTCHRLIFDDPGSPPVENLFAQTGHEAHPHFCFAGHVDVVPPGDIKAWSHHPFEGHLEQKDRLYGRGAVDMKGAIAAFIKAVDQFIKNDAFKGTISFLLTADEEGVAINGTRKVLQWLEQQKITMDFCLVGEPTCQAQIGDTIKVGRRGSLNTVLTIQGKQGHVAYSDQAINPIPALLQCLTKINQGPVEPLNPVFSPTNVEITSIDVGNPTVNVIPQSARAQFNIRFNDNHTGQSLQNWITSVCQEQGGDYQLEFSLSGEADYSHHPDYTDLLKKAIHEETAEVPHLTTAGGTSDARFIRAYAPVLEFGLKMHSMHQIDEYVDTSDLVNLTGIYYRFLQLFFKL